MADDERAGNGGAERESRFVNLLQPNRDMATNWSVDVGKQLEGYLDELKATGLFDDGDSPLNFAEAALLIQGSIQVYSRKVEYLYNLVVRALDYLAQKKQGQEGETPSSQENDQGCDSADETEENFLNLDDEVDEEAHIDILDEDGLDSRNQPMKVPSCLLVTEGESLDMSGEAGELASYYVATCTMYRNFLLLDPSDTATVDKYLSSEENFNRESGEDSAVPSSSAPRGNGEHDPREFSAAPTENNVKTPGKVQTPGGMDMGEADWQGDGDEEMMWDDPHVEDHASTKDQATAEDQGPSTEAPTSSNPVASERDPYIDPWVPLNPHEPGTLPVKPFKKGSTQRSLKPRKDRCSPAFVTKRFGLFFPEFAKVLHTKERQAKTRRRGVEPSNAEHARSFCRDSDGGQSVETPLDPVYDEGLGGEFGDSDHEYSAYDDFEEGHHFDGGNEDLAPPVDTPEKQDIPCQDNTPFSPRQDSLNVELGIDEENMSLEDLCRAHVDSILQKLAESQVRSGLNARVTTWKNKIEATLKDESLPPFDIHEYGDRLLARLSTSAATSRNQEETQDANESFTNLVNGQRKDEVARSFSALLQLEGQTAEKLIKFSIAGHSLLDLRKGRRQKNSLNLQFQVNSGNVTIDKGSVGSGSYCFSAENAFRVRLLNSQNRHNEMFQHMVPPQNVSKTTGRRKVSEQTDNSGPSERLSSPVVSYSKTPRSGLRVGSATALFMSPSSVRKSSRKRGQSAAGKVGGVMDSENRGIGTPDKGYTPVKLTPNRRRSKRKPLQTIQV